MTILISSGNQTKQRADGHKSLFFLSVIKPTTLLTALVSNSSIERGAMTIAVDNGSSIDLARIKEGQTFKAIINGRSFFSRIVSASLSGSSPTITGSIVIDANGIAFIDNGSIEIIENYELRAIPPTFDPTTGISKKRGQVYAGQNLEAPPIAQFSPNRANFYTGTDYQFTILESASKAIAPGASITGITAAVAPTAGASLTPSGSNIIAAFSSVGQWWLSTTATDSNGNTHTTHRRIFLHSTDPESSDYPYVNFVVSGVSVSWDGSSQVNFQVHGVADFSEFVDGAMVILWQRAWYGDVEGPISLITGGENILWQGYILSDSIDQDWNKGIVSFRAGNIWEVAKSVRLQALYLQAESVPSRWFQYDYRLTPARLLHWHGYWHSSLFEIAEVALPTSAELKKIFKFNEGTLASQWTDLASKIPAKVACNKAGMIYVEEDINDLDTAGRAAVDEWQPVTSGDWRDRITIQRRHKKQVSVVKAKGFNFDGQTLTPICSIAPNRVGDDAGSSTMAVDGLILANQAHANRLSGRFLAKANNEIADVRLPLAGNYSVLDVVPQRWLTMDLAAADTERGLEWTDQRLVPRQISFNIDQVNGFISTDVVCEPEVAGPDGITDACPDVPPAETPPAAWVEPEAVNSLLSFSSIWYRDDNQAEWTENLPSGNSAVSGAVDSFWREKQGTTDPSKAIIWWVDGATGVFRSIDAGVTRQEPRPVTDPPNTWSDSPAPVVGGLSFVQVERDLWNSGRFILVARWQNGSGLWRSWIAVTNDDGVSWQWYPLCDTGALPTQVKAVWLAIGEIFILATTWEDETTDGLRLHKRNAATLAFVADYDLGAVTLAQIDARDWFAFPVTVVDDPDLWFVAGRMNAPVGLLSPQHVIKTTNAGTSWSSVENSWGADICIALKVGVNDGGRKFYAARQSDTPVPIAFGAGTYTAAAQLSATRGLAAYSDINTKGQLRLLDTTTNPPTLLAQGSLPGANIDDTYLRLATIDSNHVAIAYRAHDNDLVQDAVRLAIIDVTGDGISVGTPATIALVAGTHVGLAVLSTTKAVVTYADGSDGNKGKGAVCDLNTSTDIVTPNAVQTFQGTAGVSYTTCAKVDSSTAVVFYQIISSLDMYANVLDAITTSWTLGSDTPVDTGNSTWDNVGYQYAYNVDSTRVLAVYQYKTVAPGNDYLIRAIAGSVTGSTVTFGSTADATSGPTYDERPVVTLTSSNIVKCLYSNSTSIQQVDLTLSGTAVSPGSSSQLISLPSGADYFSIDGSPPMVVYVDTSDSNKVKATVL